MGLLYGENYVILASTVFDWSNRVTDRRTDGRTDGQTDGIAIAYTRYSIYAVARKNYYELVTETGDIIMFSFNTYTGDNM